MPNGACRRRRTQKMAMLRLPIRIVLYKEVDQWIAHCLEFNLVGDGPTKGDAVASLVHFIRAQVDSARDHQNPANLYSPARGRYYQMFAEGKDVADIEVAFKKEELEGLVGDQVSYREYADNNRACA